MVCTRTFILPLISLNAFVNIYILYRILVSWKGLNSDAESEWEGGGQQIARTLAAILVAYILLAFTAATIGFHGVYKRLPASVRIYAQFSAIDLLVYLLSTVIFVFNFCNSREWRDDMCEEVATHPDILSALRSSGFYIENCESWVEKLLMGAMTMLGVGLILKIQFTLAIASHYALLAKATGHQASVFSSIRIPPTRKSSRAHRDRHVLLTMPRTADLPPYSDSAQTPTMGPEAAQAVAELVKGKSRPRSLTYESHSSSSSTDDTSLDAKRRA